MEKFNSSKAIAVVTTALFVGSLFWLMNAKRVNNSLEAGLQEQKLKSEAMLSEKLLLEKDLQKFKDQLFKLKDENKGLDALVKKTSARLSSQEAEYNRMKRENVSLGQIKKQRQELQAIKNQLEMELTAMRTSYAELEAKNRELNGAVVSLQERNRILSEDLNRAMFAAIDQSQIQAVRGKSERLTVSAKRTKKLIANFEVPANLKSLGFRIRDSKGNTLTSREGNIAFTSIPSEKSLTASSEAGAEVDKLQKVEMVYIPKEKLKTGIYTVEILNENLYVGSLKVKLK
jgi:predicted  nucleic acid-binding Zn-ribbon protein